MTKVRAHAVKKGDRVLVGGMPFVVTRIYTEKETPKMAMKPKSMPKPTKPGKPKGC